MKTYSAVGDTIKFNALYISFGENIAPCNYRYRWYMRLLDVLYIPIMLGRFVATGNAKSITWTLKEKR